jgi:hypothetical protein
MQQQNSSFASRLGARVAEAHDEHKDSAVDTGDRRLPAGIRAGIAKISTAYTKQQTDDTGGKTPKGETFFRISAVVVSPVAFKGEKVAGMVTSVVIPLCDVPAKGERKAKSFKDQWFEFQNLFKLLGINPPSETAKTDPTGRKIEAYYFAAMKTICDPARPTYVEFSTRGFTPKQTPEQAKAGITPEEFVMENWHGLAKFDGTHDPASGFSEAPSTSPNGNAGTSTPPPTDPPFEEPPMGQVVMPDEPTEPLDLAYEVAVLVEAAMNDPEGATTEGAEATHRLEVLAWENGWTKEQTGTASGWDAVGDMALTEPTATPTPTAPTVGSKHKFAKRDSKGAKLRNAKKEEFPPVEVEVASVDVANKICTVKTAKDGKDVIDIRSKKPVAVKWEWLE